MSITRYKPQRMQAGTPLIVFDFLQRLGVLTPKGVAPDVVRGYRNVLRKISAEDRANGARPENTAAALAVMAKLDDEARGVGLPGSMIELCGEMTARMIEEEAHSGRRLTNRSSGRAPRAAER